MFLAPWRHRDDVCFTLKLSGKRLLVLLVFHGQLFGPLQLFVHLVRIHPTIDHPKHHRDQQQRLENLLLLPGAHAVAHVSSSPGFHRNFPGNDFLFTSLQYRNNSVLSEIPHETLYSWTVASTTCVTLSEMFTKLSRLAKFSKDIQQIKKVTNTVVVGSRA